MALKTIVSPSGARFTVNAEYADRFQNLVNGLEEAGYPIKGDQSGGYNYRNIAGTNRLSNHAHGNAIDVNWSENARGKPGQIPEDLARRLAQENGLTWGGTWNNRDDMHFEVAGAPKQPGTQVAGIGSGATSPVAAAAAPAVGDNDALMTSADEMARKYFGWNLGGDDSSKDEGAAAAAKATSAMNSAESGAKGDSPLIGMSYGPKNNRVDVAHMLQVLSKRAKLGTA